MTFGQLVIGAPGSGKSTYCRGMQQFLTAIGRETVIVNLDPANEDVHYECVVNITDLITVEDVMEEYGLGLNGSLIFCMEWLEKNLHLLKERLEPYETKYILFDLPGQAELYTHHLSMRNIIRQIQKWEYQLVAVHLVDSHLCIDPNHYVAGLLMSLASMTHLELPQVNVLSKVDLFEQYSGIPYSLDYYTNVMDLDFLQRHVEPVIEDEDEDHNDKDESENEEKYEVSVGLKPTSQRTGPTVPPPLPSRSDDDSEGTLTVDKFIKGHKRLTAAICEMIEEYSLVNFIPLSITDKELMYELVKNIDRGNGYVFAEMDFSRVQDSLLQLPSGSTAAEAQAQAERKFAEDHPLDIVYKSRR